LLCADGFYGQEYPHDIVRISLAEPHPGGFAALMIPPPQRSAGIWPAFVPDRGQGAHAPLRFAMAFWAAFVLSPIASPAASPDGTIPFDSRWDFANYISWRPANVRPVSLNPPRFSWPASPVIPPFASHRAKDGLVFPRYEYVFQLSQNPEFVAGRETIEKRTTINFENAFPILAEGTWYWRVGYSRPDAAPEQWSAIRTFTITPGTLSIDRTPIARAAADLAALPRPRLAPPDNDWAALRKRLEADYFTAPIIKHLLSSAEGILTKDGKISPPMTPATGRPTRAFAQSSA